MMQDLSARKHDFDKCTGVPGSPVRRSATALLCGYYGMKNLGDELMLISIERWLSQQNIAVTILAENAPEVVRQHGVPAVQNWPLLGQWNLKTSWLKGRAAALIRQIAAADLMIAGGGDIIRDELGLRAFSYQVEKIILAILLRKPVYLVNVGITQPRTPFGRAILSWILPRCRQIIVRDRRSVEICKAHGAERTTVFLPDIVCTFADAFPAGTKPSRPYIIVALHARPDIYHQYDLENGTRLSTLAAAVDTLATRLGAEVVFVPCQSDSATDDHAIHRRLRGLMDPETPVRFQEWTVQPADVASLFGGSSMVIAMRLHAGILAYSYGRPCVVLPYDTKVSEFAEQASIPMIRDKDLDKKQTTHTALEEALTQVPRCAAAGRWAHAALSEQ